MNDSELKSRVEEAFGAIEVPADVKANTLAALKRACEDASADVVITRSESSAIEVGEDASAVVVPLRGEEKDRVSREEKKASARSRFKAHGFFRRSLAAAACLLAVVFGVGATFAYAQPTAYIGIDVNPSIELRLNRFDRVIEAQGLNADGIEVLATVDLVGKSYDEAMRSLSSDPVFAAYLTPDSYLQVSVTSEDANQASKLEEQSATYISELPCKGSCVAVDAQTREEARSAGIGAGKYLAAQALMEIDPAVTLEECSHLSMRELRDRIDEAGGDWDTTANSSCMAQDNESRQKRAMKGKSV